MWTFRARLFSRNRLIVFFRCKSEICRDQSSFCLLRLRPPTGSRSAQQNSALALQQKRGVDLCACATGELQPGVGHQQLLKY